MKLSDYVMDFIVARGVGHVFMLPGGGAMHLNDSLGKHPDLKYTCNLHEQACAIAADAYAQYTGGLGVAMVTTGPGGTNAITGVAGSWLDSIPVLVISGQVKRADLATGRGIRQMGFQELPVTELVKPITKYSATAMEPRDIRYHLEKAVFLALSCRPGPVWLDIPLDVQAAEINPGELQGFIPDAEGLTDKPIVPDLSTQVGRIISLLNQAERPAILAGNGVRLAGALTEFEKVIRLLDIPVLLTWKALDFLDDTDPLYAGRPGAIGQRAANFTQQNTDLLLIIGARLDHGQTGYNHANFAKAAKKIMVDVDAAEIAKMDFETAEAIPADARDFLAEIIRQSGNLRPANDRTPWKQRISDWKKRYPVITPEHWKRTDAVDLYALMDAISQAMDSNDLLIPGSSGQCSELTMQAFKAKKGQRVFNTEGLGPMGFGLPAAIGACIASGGKHTVCIDGDGGFQMNIQELDTLHRLQLPIKIFVLNNQGYGSIRNTQRNYFDSRYVASDTSSGLTLPDTCKIATAYGLPNSRLESNKQLLDKIRHILDAPGPHVCDVIVPKDQPTEPKLSSFRRPDGSMESRPLEDLAPFLDRDEFNANMLP
ncbi:MAG: thiamine pyrophosphate-binding protein [Victivallales bacterium]|nr:thiamine pyrophosphate-binding protein [Victivallales bacterium]